MIKILFTFYINIYPYNSVDILSPPTGRDTSYKNTMCGSVLSSYLGLN